jgi:hypothetical protein
VRVRVPHQSEGERLRVHGVRKTVNCPEIDGGSPEHVRASCADVERPLLDARRAPVHQGAVVKRLFSIFNCLILDSSVDGGIPSLAAAPRGPATLPLLFARAASIISLS